MDSPTQAQIERALAIVKAHYPEMPASYRGRRYQVALAAIIETQEACARIADREAAAMDDEFQKRARVDPDDSCSNYLWSRGTARGIALAIRKGCHLKGTQNAE